MNERGSLVDRGTQTWVKATGRTVPLTTFPWLNGPVGDPSRIGDTWIEREGDRLGGQLREGGGLLGSFDDLASDRFDPAQLVPAVVEFYENTVDWRLDVWSQWCPFMFPGGWFLSIVFARRLQQLALPLRPLDVALGMDSRVVSCVDDGGAQLGAAWLRTLRSTGQTVYSGWYGITQLPLPRGPSVRVMFPLPNGSLAIFLEPSVDAEGALHLTSPIARFGDNGAYLIVERGPAMVSVRRVPLFERFRVFLDNEGILRADHAVDLGPIPTLRLHYRLQQK